MSTAASQVALKAYTLFTNCITNTDGTTIDDTRFGYAVA